MGNPADSSLGKIVKDAGNAIGGVLDPSRGVMGKAAQADPFGFGPMGGGLMGSVDQALQNQAQTHFVGERAAQQAQAEKDRLASENEALAKKEKANLDYLTGYNKNLADQEALTALEDARADTRKSKGRQINFFG